MLISFSVQVDENSSCAQPRGNSFSVIKCDFCRCYLLRKLLSTSSLQRFIVISVCHSVSSAFSKNGEVAQRQGTASMPKDLCSILLYRKAHNNQRLLLYFVKCLYFKFLSLILSVIVVKVPVIVPYN